MSKFLVFTLLLVIQSISNLSSSVPTQPIKSKRNDRPIIGILAQESDEDVSISYIAAPYVKQMESSGARVIPVLIQQEEDYYRRIIHHTNGLLIPGGHLNITGSYFRRAAELLFKFATESNDRGDHYPIYGVCRGLQMVSLLILKQWAQNPHSYWLTSCSAEDLSLNLNFLVDPSSTRLFKSAAPSVIQTLTREGVTPNYHQKCLTPQAVKMSGLDSHLKITSTSNDSNGLEFVSTLESLNSSRPIYLLQWHPEKIVYEFLNVPGIQTHTKHTSRGILAAQFVANFIVEESRKNFNRFGSSEEEDEEFIYNCNPLYSARGSQDGSILWKRFSQIYWFDSKTGCGGKGGNIVELGQDGLIMMGMGLIVVGMVVGWLGTRICTRSGEK